MGLARCRCCLLDGNWRLGVLEHGHSIKRHDSHVRRRPLVENDAVPAGSENSEPSLPGNEASDATASSPTGQPEASNPSLDKTQTPDPQVAPDVETPSEENAKAAEVGTPETEKPKTDSADAEKPTQDMAKAESSESKEKSSPAPKVYPVSLTRRS